MTTGLKRERRPFAYFVLAMVIALGAGGCSRESRKAKYVESANQYLAAGDYSKAEIELLNALRLSPTDPNVIAELGNIYYEQGNLPKAFVFFKRTVELKVGGPDARIKLGRLYLTGHKYKEAREEAMAVLDQQVSSDDAWIVYSQACVSTNEIAEGFQKLESFRSRAEGVPGFHLAWGTLAFRQQDLKVAEESFSRALTLGPKFGPAHELMGNLQFRLKNVAKGGEYLKAAAEMAPIRSVTRLRYSDYLKEAGDEKAALAVAEEVSKKAPDYIPGSVHLAQLLAPAGRIQEAQELVKRVLNVDPVNYDAMLLNGRLLLATKEIPKGVAELEKLARGYAQSAQAHHALAVAYLANNESAKAFNSVSQAVTLDGNYADAVLLRAELNIQKGDAASAIPDLQLLIRNQPQIGRAYVLLGNAQAARRNYSEALAAYGRMAELFPKTPVPHQLLGTVFARQGKRTEARQAFERARELSPDYLPAFEQLVLLDVADRNFAGALARARQEMQRSPKLVAPYLLSATVYNTQTNLAEAERSINKALELEPDNRAALMMLSRLMIQSGRQKEAVERLEALAAKNPSDYAALMQIGILQSEKGDFAAARDAYERVLKIKPDYVPALNNLAVLYSERFSMLDQAFETARRARELSVNDPQNGPVTADTFGWIQFQRGEYAWALGLLEQSSQNLPDEPEVSFHLGMVYYMMGDEASARAALARAVDSPKTYNGRDEAVRRLQFLNLQIDSADPGVIAQLEKQFAAQPGDPVVAGRLAAIEEKKGAYDKAATIYEQTLAKNKSNVGAMSRAAKLYAERLNNPKRALELAKQAREASPENPELAHTLGFIAYETGDQPWAVSLLEESSRKLPDNPDVLFDLALAQYSVGRVSDAESTMKRALNMGKPFDRAEAGRRWLTLSSLYSDATRLRQSAAAVAEWLKAEPSNPAVLMAAGALHEMQSNTSAAQQSYERILALYPAFSPASLHLAGLYANIPSELQKAYDIVSRLRQSLPNDPEVAKTLGIISHKRGDHSRAVTLLKESSRKLATDPMVFFYLGLAHQQLKQNEECKQALEKVLTMNPDSKTAAESRRVIGELN